MAKFDERCDNPEPHPEHEWFSENTSLNDTLVCPGVEVGDFQSEWFEDEKDYDPDN